MAKFLGLTFLCLGLLAWIFGSASQAHWLLVLAAIWQAADWVVTEIGRRQ